MKQNQKNRIIVVLGMHRSGTSAITYSLRLLSVGLGDKIHPAGFDNPKGFWEDRDCLEINESLLSHLGSAYDRLDLAWECTRGDASIDALKSEAKQIVIRKLKENDGLWGFKDPRTCRLLSFWRDVFDSAGCTVNYVIVLRNPLSVASSLNTRNRIPVEKSYFLWLQHLLPAVLGSAGSPRLVVDYDLLMESPLEQVGRISEKFRLPIADENSDMVHEFLNDFLDHSLRHTKFSTKDLEQDSHAPIDIVRGYDLLMRASRDEISIDSPDIGDYFQNLYDRLKSFAPAFTYVNALEDEQIALCKGTAERDKQISNLNNLIGERDREVTNLNQAVAGLDTQIANLNQVMAGRDAQIANLNQVMAEKINLIDNLNQAVAERNDRIVHIDGLLDEILRSKSWQFTKPLRYIRRNLLNRPYLSFRRSLSVGAHRGWNRLPISLQGKRKLKNYLFKSLPLVFGRTEAYRRWKSYNEPIHRGEYVSLTKGKPLRNKPVKLICFYLPQFHPIPENDNWWGTGFTEWTNVRAAQPQFKDHYQPRVPGELGYYNLLSHEIQRRQVELAKLYGIEGFCFYFYWFGGKRLLEKPIENYLNDSDLDLPFCLCWANENWSRRWDGLDSEILIAQQHSAKDDLDFISHVARYLRDPRYIRINGKPLLLIYRPSLLPSAIDTAQRWRSWCRDKGIGEIYLAYTQAFESVDPIAYGFDAAIEFPPSDSTMPNVTDSDVTEFLTPLSKEFGCTAYDWRTLVNRSEKYEQPGFKLFRGVCPSWDNTARRKNQGTVFVNNSPYLYQRWLENAIRDTEQQHANHDERLIFINAWNEWAEGAYLEPDEGFGYAWLQATRDALSYATQHQEKSILLVTHDCHPHGAQLLILAVAKQLKLNRYKVSILALGGGSLITEFDQVGRTLNAEYVGVTGMKDFLDRLRSEGTVDAITSTVVSGSIVPQLKELGFQVLSLIHELPGTIHQMKQENNARLIAQHADTVVFPARMVCERFFEIEQVPTEKVLIRPQGVLRKNPYKSRRAEAHRKICKKHNLPTDTQIVLSIAYADKRKGPDLFVEMASNVLKLRSNIIFIWIGIFDPQLEDSIKARINALGLQEQVLFIGYEREPMAYYAAASVYALTSREDPFPNVVLESAEVGVPVVAFQDVSGAADFIVEHGGRLAVYLDTNNFARQVCELLDAPVEQNRADVGSLQQYTLDLLHHLNGFPRISVMVPNYNYERHITKRLDTIYYQTFPIYEVIVLDDASSDNSVECIIDYLERTGNDAQVFVNDHNSGSVFRQWQKGISHSKGDLLWIAEADDLSDNEFLSSLSHCFQDLEVVMAYSQSMQIDDNGKLIAENYLNYTEDVSDFWLTDYEREGLEEISEALVIKNTIPNVSAVLFHRQSLEDALRDIGEELYKYHVAGDWLVYLHVLKRGKVYFCKNSLNLHRLHTKSITKTLMNHKHLEEVMSVQAVARVLSDPPKEVLAKADAYISLLYKHFGIQQN